MERRYNDKERAWRDTFSRLRLHLGIGGGLEPPEEEEPPAAEEAVAEVASEPARSEPVQDGARATRAGLGALFTAP